MHSRRVTKRVQGIVAFFLAAIILQATQPLAAYADTGQAFSISPPVVELTGSPGQTITTTIKLTNVSDGDLAMRTDFNDFGTKDETGAPKIIFDDTQSTTYSLKNWISAPAPFTMQSKETKTLTFPIRIPANAEPGGHYAVIRFTGTAPELQNGVALSASIGTLVLLEVSGNIKEDASVVEFKSMAPTFAADSSFFETGPVGFRARIKNSGNVHIKPTGTIEIKNIFGNIVATIHVNGDATDPKNPPKSVLPDSIRRFDETMPNQGMIGPYTATLSLTYGQSQKTLTATTSFWVIPYRLIAIILVLGAGLFFAGRAGIRRYNASIIAKAQSAQQATKQSPKAKK